jgi:hypothetical protein
VKDLIDADLALGGHRALIPELRRLVEEHPHRERLRGQLMIALYRSGRQADALDAYQAARSALNKLGLEPSATLRMIERQILTQDPILDLAGAAPLTQGIGGRASPGQLIAASALPLVGYTSELSALQSLLDRVVDDGAPLLLVAVVRAMVDRQVRSEQASQRSDSRCKPSARPA